MRRLIAVALIFSQLMLQPGLCYSQASGEVLGWKEKTSGDIIYPYQIEANFTDNNDGTISLVSGGSPGGADTQIQFNNNGSFEGIAAFTYTSAADLLERKTGQDTQYGLKIDGQTTTYTGSGSVYSIAVDRRVTTPASSYGVSATGFDSYISNSHAINGADLFPGATNIGSYNQISVTGAHSASPLVYLTENNYGDYNWLTRSGTLTTSGTVTINNYGTFNTVRDEARFNSAGETLTVNNYGGKYEVTSGNYIYAGTLNVNTYGFYALARGDAAYANSTCIAAYLKAFDGDTNYDIYLDGARNIHANGGDMTITASGGAVSFDDENITSSGYVGVGYVDIQDESNGYKIDGNTAFTVVNTQNTYVGMSAGGGATGNNYDTLVGYEAGYTIDSSNGRGEKDVFVGAQAGYGATAGTNNLGGNNVGVGYRALYYLTTGYENTAVGFEALHRNTSGNYNTAIGRQALWTNQTGHYNVAIGYNSMDNHSPSGVVAVGYDALGRATWVDSSVVIGYRAAYYGAASGDNQTIVGYESGYNLTSGANNTYYGWRAGYSNQTGSGNVFLGYLAGYGETGSNKLYIDNSSTAAPLIYGDFLSDELTINGTMIIKNILELSGLGSDPSSPQDGSIWHRSDLDEIRVRLGGSTYKLALSPV